MPTATSLAITCTATMVTASHWVGFTLPGMMELTRARFRECRSRPGRQRGPLASQRTSLAIFIRLRGQRLERAVREYQIVLGSQGVELVFRGHKVLAGQLGYLAAATSTAKPARRSSGPVPTAVPPRASSFSPDSARLQLRAWSFPACCASR